MPHPPALLAMCLDSEVNVAVAFNRRSSLLEEYCLCVSKCLQQLDASYVLDWDCVSKGLLRGDVQMSHTFVVGSPRQDCDDAKNESSDDEVELADGQAITPSKASKVAAVKAPTPKPKAAHCDGKTPSTTLGPFHQRVQQANASATQAKRK